VFSINKALRLVDIDLLINVSVQDHSGDIHEVDSQAMEQLDEVACGQ
jgi:hypothetical protein